MITKSPPWKLNIDRESLKSTNIGGDSVGGCTPFVGRGRHPTRLGDSKSGAASMILELEGAWVVAMIGELVQMDEGQAIDSNL